MPPFTQRERDIRNLDPHKPAVAAMAIYGSRYAAQRGDSMDFWDHLSPGEQQTCRELVKRIAKAKKEPKVARG